MGRVNLSALTEEESTVRFFRREFDIDVMSVYERLKSIAKIPASKFKDRFVLMEELNSASHNAYLANMIYLKINKQREIFRIEFNREMRDLSRLATARVNHWLEVTVNIRKQITQSMVLEEIVSHDESRHRYEKLIQRQEELREIRDNLKCLADQWSDRKMLLQTQAKLLLSQKEIVLGHGGHDNVES